MQERKDKTTVWKSLRVLTALIPVFAFISADAQEVNGTYYPNPGIVAQRGGKWVGSDHLYNLSNKIGIKVEIFKPQNAEAPITEEAVAARIEEIFRKGKIEPKAESISGKPPLPFFHLLLMVYPIDKGFVVFCEGRLFEEVHVDRVILDQQTVMQAVTWESENLIIASHSDAEEQIHKSVDEIANTFMERFAFYSNIKSEIRK